MIQITEQEYEALRRVAEAAWVLMDSTTFQPDDPVAKDVEQALDHWDELERSKR